jgi:hypothetical protein
MWPLPFTMNPTLLAMAEFPCTTNALSLYELKPMLFDTAPLFVIRSPRVNGVPAVNALNPRNAVARGIADKPMVFTS